jgi:hypothetical protein
MIGSSHSADGAAVGVAPPNAAVGIRGRLRHLSQLHEDRAVIAWWTNRTTGIAGRLTPERRRWLLSLAAIGALGGAVAKALGRAANADVPPLWIAAPIASAVLLAALYGCYRAATGFASLPAPVRARPQVALHLAFWAVLVVVWMMPRHWNPPAATVVAIATLLPFVLWRCGYLLKTGQRGRAAGTRFADHLFYLFPIYGGRDAPIGKGFDNLTRHEAHSADALAKSQLAGMKLLILSLIWRGAEQLMNAAVYAEPTNQLTPLLAAHGARVPPLDRLLAQRVHVAPLVAWSSIYVELVRQVLRHAAWGHVTVGVLRLLGFNVFRNTYKPLLAESIVEFWNRYYYYFKELLVDFFFFPTFVRHFRRWPRLRMVAATFAAAFVGNLYYHALAHDELILTGDVRAAWTALHARTFYCLLLAAGISVSMLREQRRRGTAVLPGRATRLVRIFGVWTFFAVIHVWGVGAQASFTRRTEFFLSLFGLA